MNAGGLDTVSSPAFTDEDPARFRAAGWWSDSTLSDAVRRNAVQPPDHPAYVDHGGLSLTWREFDNAATNLAEQLAGVGIARGDRVAVWHGDSAAIHVLFLAIERCGASTWPTKRRAVFLSFGDERRWAGYRGLAGIHRRGLGPVSCGRLVV